VGPCDTEVEGGSQAACVEALELRSPDLDPAGASDAAVATTLGEGRWRQREEGNGGGRVGIYRDRGRGRATRQREERAGEG
jgi:hypothetical protein